MYIPRVSPADPQTKQRFFVGDVQAHLGDMDAAWGGGRKQILLSYRNANDSDRLYKWDSRLKHRKPHNHNWENRSCM